MRSGSYGKEKILDLTGPRNPTSNVWTDYFRAMPCQQYGFINVGKLLRDAYPALTIEAFVAFLRISYQML
jgi:hypothetical protein